MNSVEPPAWGSRKDLMAPKRQYAPAPFIVIVMMSQIFLFLNREKKKCTPIPWGL